MTRLAYDTDLSDDQWECLAPYLPAAKPGGRPRTLDLREVVNAIFYLLSNGIKWRAMPHDLPRWQSVYTYFRAWERDGTWQQLNAVLRTQLRLQAGRNAQPSAGSVDSQSVKTGTMVQQSVGYDGGKRVKGRKRHLVVDTLGLMMTVVVTAASVPEREGAKLVFAKLAQMREQFGRLVLIWVDGGYRGELLKWVAARCALCVSGSFAFR